MSFFKKLFGSKEEKTQEQDTTPSLSFIEASQNPWGVRLLDISAITQHMVSTSNDKKLAENAISYGSEDGSSFFGEPTLYDTTIEVDLSYRTDRHLYPGVLFIPNTMEHKWAIYFDGIYLFLIRSWTREIWIKAKTRQEPNRLIVETIIGDFGGDYSPEFTQAILNFIIISHVTNEVTPAPLPLEMETSTKAAAYWAFSIYGNMANYGVFNHSFIPVNEKALRSHSLFHIDIARENLEKARLHLAHGMDINALAGDGLSPIHWSLASITTDSLVFLLENNADPNVRSSEGATPLMNAVQSNKTEKVRILLNAGANVNATDNRGFTALHRASEMNLIEIVELLLSYGADKNIVAMGHTALSLAESRKCKEIIALLNQ